MTMLTVDMGPFKELGDSMTDVTRTLAKGGVSLKLATRIFKMKLAAAAVEETGCEVKAAKLLETHRNTLARVLPRAEAERARKAHHCGAKKTANMRAPEAAIMVKEYWESRGC